MLMAQLNAYLSLKNAPMSKEVEYRISSFLLMISRHGGWAKFLGIIPGIQGEGN